jgi:hypothetical protein
VFAISKRVESVDFNRPVEKSVNKTTLGADDSVRARAQKPATISHA